MGRKVFLSYARSDGEFARRLGQDLRANHIDVWIDQFDIRAGELWDQAVEKALTECAAVVVVLSPASVSSRSVMDEVSYALDENKIVAPVLYQNAAIPLRLRRLQYTNFTGDYAAALAELRQALSPFQTEEAAKTPDPSSLRIHHVAEPAGKVTGAQRLRGAVTAGLLGAVYGGLCEWFLLRSDIRIKTTIDHSLGYWVAFGAIAAGVLWGIAGAIAGRRRAPLAWAVIAAAFTAVVWTVLFGTYVDVVVTGDVLGSPAAAIIGASVNRFYAKRTARAIPGGALSA